MPASLSSEGQWMVIGCVAGQRTADGIVNYVMSQARSAAMSRLSGRKSGGESSRGGGGESSRGGGGKVRERYCHAVLTVVAYV